MEVKKIQCKTALSSSSLPGLLYSLNAYRGCQHHCAYCYAPSVLRMKQGQWDSTIEVKINIPMILAKELKTKKPGVVGISTVTDPYQPVEQKYLLTRYCLEQLLKVDFPIHIQTKSTLVTRDIDLISRFSESQVMMSIATAHDEQRKLLEPYSSSIQERLSALRTYADAGVKTSVFFGPVYPTTSLEEIASILDTFREAGATEIWIDMLRLKPGIWNNIQKGLIQNQEVFRVFSQHVFENKNYYMNIREEIRKKGKERNLKILDAF
jgi:DNA repair photolyase